MRNKQALIVEKPRYSEGNECDQLLNAVRSHNKAMKDKGLKFLRSFLSSVVTHPQYSMAKPLLDHVNRGNIGGSLEYASSLLSQQYDSAELTFRMRQTACFVKKYPFIGNDVDCQNAAEKKFLRGERRNSLLNLLMRRRRATTGDTSETRDSLLTDVYTHDMRSYIRRIIGDKPDMSRLLVGVR